MNLLAILILNFSVYNSFKQPGKWFWLHGDSTFIERSVIEPMEWYSTEGKGVAPSGFAFSNIYYPYLVDGKYHIVVGHLLRNAKEDFFVDSVYNPQYQNTTSAYWKGFTLEECRIYSQAICNIH